MLFRFLSFLGSRVLIIMKARDPRKLNNTLTTTVLTGSTPSQAITDVGKYIFYPTIVVSGGFGFTGAGSTITVSNVQTGEYISLSGTAVSALAPTANSKIIIDMHAKRMYTGTNVNNAYQYITSGSTFPWYLGVSGTSTLGFSVPTYGTASAQVEWRECFV